MKLRDAAGARAVRPSMHKSGMREKGEEKGLKKGEEKGLTHIGTQ